MKTMGQIVREAKDLALGLHETPGQLSATMLSVWNEAIDATKDMNNPSHDYVLMMEDYAYEIEQIKDDTSLENFLKMLFNPLDAETDEDAIREYAMNGNALFVNLNESDEDMYDTSSYLADQFMIGLIGTVGITV